MGGEESSVRRWWITPERYQTLGGTLQRLNRDGWDAFLGVNPRSYRASGEDAVRTVRAFHVDLDAPSRVPGSAGKNPTEGIVGVFRDVLGLLAKVRP